MDENPYRASQVALPLDKEIISLAPPPASESMYESPPHLIVRLVGWAFWLIAVLIVLTAVV